MGPLELGDIRDATVLQRVFETWRPEAVLHFAAYAYVGESNIEPLKYYQNNVGGTVSLLNACVSFRCRSFVFSSSCATYGVPGRVPLTETDPQLPINPYGYRLRNLLSSEYCAMWRQRTEFVTWYFVILTQQDQTLKGE